MAMSEKEKYQKWHSSPKAIQRRSARNKARRFMENLVGAKAIEGKDIDHKSANAGGKLSNAPSNLRILSIKKNRGKDANSWRKTKKRNH